MSATEASVRIAATPEARQALKAAAERYGPVMFHTSGGRVGGRHFPICLPQGALRLGARDHLLGNVDGVPIYEMEERDGEACCRGTDYVLDVAIGPAIGFSIDAGPGKRFTLTRVAENHVSAGQGLGV